MTLNELKTKCNELYGKALEAFERGGDAEDIRRCLLDAAGLLVEIGKVSVADNARAQKNAAKLLEAAKILRLEKDAGKAYLLLTGKALQVAEKVVDVAPEPKVEQVEAKPKVEQVAPKIEPRAKETPVFDKDVRKLLKDKPKTNNTPTPKGYRFNWDRLPEITFDDVAGLADVKEAVFKKVLLPLSQPELYEGYDKKNGGGLLLYGPPGTGKTMIAAAIAKEIGAKFCSVGASDVLMNGIGASEKAIDALFEEARSFDCAVIFFDEIESICPATTHAQHAKEIRSELLRQMQGLEAYGKKSDKILFLIAATNKPWDIDSAFVRPGRFGTRIYVGLPDDDARRYMVKTRLDKIKSSGKVSVGNMDYDKVVALTDGFNGSDVTALLDEVQEISILRAARGGEKTLDMGDFETALQKITSSVQKKDLLKLDEWRRDNC